MITSLLGIAVAVAVPFVWAGVVMPRIERAVARRRHDAT